MTLIVALFINVSFLVNLLINSLNTASIFKKGKGITLLGAGIPVTLDNYSNSSFIVINFPAARYNSPLFPFFIAIISCSATSRASTTL